MTTQHEQIVAAYETYLAENEKFTAKGVKAAAARARKALQARLGRVSSDDESEKKELVKQFISKRLSRSEKLVIILYYYEEMTFKEIGATLDLSESRVSQIHSSIVARILDP